MIQRDYIMRMIEQFGQFVSALVQLRETGRLEEARAVIDQALIGLVGTDLRSATEQPAERLVATVRFATRMYASTAPSAEQLNLLGRLMREAARVLEDQGDHDTATRVRFQALDIHVAVLTVDDPSSSESAAAVDELLHEVRDFVLPASLKRQLWTIYEVRGEYARAEDLLFEALEDRPDVADLLAESVATYERLSLLDDDALRGGGVSRDEVMATLEELRQRATDVSDSSENRDVGS